MVKLTLLEMPGGLDGTKANLIRRMDWTGLDVTHKILLPSLFNCHYLIGHRF